MIDIERQKGYLCGIVFVFVKEKGRNRHFLAVTVPNAKIIDDAYSNGDSHFSEKENIVYE